MTRSVLKCDHRQGRFNTDAVVITDAVTIADAVIIADAVPAAKDPEPDHRLCQQPRTPNSQGPRARPSQGPRTHAPVNSPRTRTLRTSGSTLQRQTAAADRDSRQLTAPGSRQLTSPWLAATALTPHSEPACLGHSEPRTASAGPRAPRPEGPCQWPSEG